MYELTHYVGDMKPEQLKISEKNGIVTISGECKTGNSEYMFVQKSTIPYTNNVKEAKGELKSYLHQGHVILQLPK
jgi:hypothetical protein